MPKFSWNLLEQMPIVAIARNLKADDLYTLLPGFRQAGLTTLEITLNTPGAEKMIEAFAKEFAGKLNIGAGTVRNMDELGRALRAGASFIVTPILDERVIRECRHQHIPVFPGAFTPTEIYRAWQWGASIVKVFPATAVEPAYFRDVMAPLDEVKLMPTGGVTLETIPGFYKAGASAFGIGSPLFDKELISRRDWHGLQEHFAKFSQLIETLRQESA